MQVTKTVQPYKLRNALANQGVQDDAVVHAQMSNLSLTSEGGLVFCYMKPFENFQVLAQGKNQAWEPTDEIELPEGIDLPVEPEISFAANVTMAVNGRISILEMEVVPHQA